MVLVGELGQVRVGAVEHMGERSPSLSPNKSRLCTRMRVEGGAFAAFPGQCRCARTNTTSVTASKS